MPTLAYALMDSGTLRHRIHWRVLTSDVSAINVEIANRVQAVLKEYGISHPTSDVHMNDVLSVHLIRKYEHWLTYHLGHTSQYDKWCFLVKPHHQPNSNVAVDFAQKDHAMMFKLAFHRED